MLNPINSNKIAKSVQRDYQQAAEKHRLTKESSTTFNNNALIKVSLTASALSAAFIIFSQFI